MSVSDERLKDRPSTGNGGRAGDSAPVWATQGMPCRGPHCA